MQRREHSRYELWFPVELKSAHVQGMAINQNVSAGGMLIALSAKLAPDEPITVTFRMPPDLQQEYAVPGRILRIETNRRDPDGLWPYRVAVVFDDVSPELVPYLEQAIRALAAPPTER